MADEIPRVNWPAFTLEQKYQWVHNGPGSDAVAPAARGLGMLAPRFAESSDAIQRALADVGLTWQGQAATAFTDHMRQTADWARRGGEVGKAGADQIHSYGGSFDTTRNKIPAPTEVGANSFWGRRADELGTALRDTFGSTFGVQSDYTKRLAAHRAADELANQALGEHETRTRQAVAAFPESATGSGSGPRGGTRPDRAARGAPVAASGGSGTNGSRTGGSPAGGSRVGGFRASGSGSGAGGSAGGAGGLGSGASSAADSVGAGIAGGDADRDSRPAGRASGRSGGLGGEVVGPTGGSGRPVVGTGGAAGADPAGRGWASSSPPSAGGAPGSGRAVGPTRAGTGARATPGDPRSGPPSRPNAPPVGAPSGPAEGPPTGPAGRAGAHHAGWRTDWSESERTRTAPTAGPIERGPAPRSGTPFPGPPAASPAGPDWRAGYGAGNAAGQSADWRAGTAAGYGAGNVAGQAVDWRAGTAAGYGAGNAGYGAGNAGYGAGGAAGHAMGNAAAGMPPLLGGAGLGGGEREHRVTVFLPNDEPFAPADADDVVPPVLGLTDEWWR